MEKRDGITVWYLLPALLVGGTERTVVDLANGLDEERYDVTLWTFFERNQLDGDLDPAVTHRTLGARWRDDSEGVPTDQRPADPLDYVRVPVRFIREARRVCPDVIHSFLTFDNVVARIAGLASPGSIVISGNRLVPVDDRLRERLDDLTVFLADHVVANSEAGARYVRRRGLGDTDVSVITNGRDLDAYGAGSAGIRESLGIGNAPVVGTVGRLVERKGHHDLIDAWPAVRERHPDAHLVIVGDGPEREALARRAEANGCAGSVHLLGTRTDVPSLLGDFDAFVFPSYGEGLPGALVEAMAAGLPIAATPVDGNAELIEDGVTGLHLSVRDPDSIAAAVCRLLADHDGAGALGDRARERALAEFSIDRMVDDFEALYDRLLGVEREADRLPA